MEIRRIGCLFLLASAIALSQTPAFEVATIKPQPWTGNGSVGVFITGDTLRGQHVGLNDLVEFAYNLRDPKFLSGGPGWAERRRLDESVLYEVVAKAPAGPPPTREQFQQMMQTLLAERFHLQIHHVQKEVPVYHLVLAKGGPKMTPSTAPKFSSAMSGGGGNRPTHLDTKAMTMQKLADGTLSFSSGRPVFDKTGLTGSYDFVLDWVSPEAQSPEGASLATALQEQLGLRLEPATAPFDSIVIDHAEKPTEN